MKFIVKKTQSLKGEVTVPASKSQTIRGLILGLLANGQSTIINPLDSEDTKIAIKACAALGAAVRQTRSSIVIKPKRPFVTKLLKIYTGDSGITTRFILPVVGLRKNHDQPVIFDCSRQMRQRPIAPLVSALNDLGMRVSYLKKRGSCPLLVQGRLLGGKTQVAGNTSQYLSALLLSLPLAPKDSQVSVKNLRERPYVNMTLKLLKDAGIKYSVKRSKNTDIYKIKGGQSHRPFRKVISGDFSSASCLLAAAALMPGKVVLKGLDFDDEQGDKQLVEILKKMDVELKVSKNQVTIKGGSKLRSFDIDASDTPDLLPALAVLASQGHGKTKIYNVPQARIKETDRIKSMSEGLSRMGLKTQEHKDGLTVHPGKLKGAAVRGFGDHRTVMAMSVAAMLAEGGTVVSNAESVNKTFPQFHRMLKALGADIKLTT